jgi:hypothetical protein
MVRHFISSYEIWRQQVKNKHRPALYTVKPVLRDLPKKHWNSHLRQVVTKYNVKRNQKNRKTLLITEVANNGTVSK